MSLSLYEISNDYLMACNDLMDREDDFSPEVIADTLEGMKGDLQVKCTNVAAYYKNMQKECSAMRKYEKNMQDRRKALESKAENLKKYLESSMIKCGISKIESPEFTLSIRKKPKSVFIDDASLIPECYTRISVSPDKVKIKEALNMGNNIPGVHLESSEGLVIK
jgi:hypothetical protein